MRKKILGIVFIAEEIVRKLLSTGDQQRSVAASYRLGHSTTNAIFNETCQEMLASHYELT
uniref:Uncharacterized protein n=1 Tax=Romanomermis culicivorax TaxID=13658 RepID=A0A915L540_ROMCU